MSPASKLMSQNTMLEAAKRYLADKAYDYLIGKTQTAKLGQILKNSGIHGINMRLIRDVLQESGKFECVDRRWTTSVRFGESGRPFERVVGNIMDSYGRTVELETLASELGQIFKRPKEVYEEQLVRFLNNKDKFFQANDGKYGLAKWLMTPTSDEEEDVLFDNFLEKSDVEDYASKCGSLKWSADSYADTISQAVKKCGEPIPGKILAFMAWDELREDFDAVDLYSSVAEDSNLVVMSDLKIYSADLVKSFEAELVKLAEQLADLPMEAEEEESDGPVTVTETDKEEIVSIIKSKGSASAEELLEAVLEVSPNESAYASALESFKEALANDDRVMWVGGTRWSKVIEFPDEVLSIPESLIIPASMPYETPEGDIFDQIIEEEGFEGDLKSAIYDPLAEDVTDEDSSRTDYQHNQDRQRCVLKYHHKLEGTFPLCQINPEFFGGQPEIIPITVIEESVRKTAYVNNATRLIYGLKDFYKNITDVSGAVFYFEKTAKPGEYRFVYTGEVDDQICIDTNKSLELLDLKSTFESTEMPIYDVVTDILEKKQGVTFVHLLTQVNIVKRCSRLLIASILSSYHCFSTRGKSGLWQYDDKKRSQGFNKSKRKYIKK